MLQNFVGGGATFRCFSTAYHPELDPHGPETRPGGRPGPWGACYVPRSYMPFPGVGKGLMLAQVCIEHAAAPLHHSSTGVNPPPPLTFRPG